VDPESAKRNQQKQRFAEDFDIIIGFLGFWALVLFVVTVVLEITGQPALIPALILGAVVLATWGMLRLRKSLPPRTGRRPR
jgi:H+/Cl- antiporter ClcA